MGALLGFCKASSKKWEENNERLPEICILADAAVPSTANTDLYLDCGAQYCPSGPSRRSRRHVAELAFGCHHRAGRTRRFPLGCAIFTFFCLLSTRRLLTGLGFVGNMVGVLLGVRIVGIPADGMAQENLRLARAEIVLLVLVAIGILLEPARWRAQLKIAAEASA